MSGPYCYGVGCARHGQCLRYMALDNSTDDRPVIGTCGHARVLFLKVAA